MFKPFAFATATCLAFGVHAEEWKDAIDATWHPPQTAAFGPPALPSGVFASDLDLDPAFGTGGLAAYYLDDPNGLEGWGLRVFARPGGLGWYVLAKHGHGNGTWDAVVVRIRLNGVAEAVYTIPTPLFRLDDATMDPVTGQFYFAGGAKPPGKPDSDFAVTCVDITVGAGGGTCAGFGTAGTAYVAFDRAGNKDDVARRVLVRPNLGVLLGGWARDGADRYVFAAAALYRTSGALVPRFGTNGRFTIDPIPSLANLDVNVFDMALSNDPDADARLYIAGNFSRDTARKDYDGIVIALNAWNGVLDSSFGTTGLRAVYLDLGNPAGNRSDAVTAIAVQANGKLALAGWSVDTYLNSRLMLARLRTDGVLDSGFCNGAGKCAPGDWWPTSGTPAYTWPTAIGERPNTRELVIATEARRGGTQPNRNDTLQIAMQFDARGSDGRAGQSFDYATAPGQDPYAVTGGMLVTSDAVMVAGTRRWTTVGNDYDATLTRVLANDTIYADTFGGAHSD